MTDEATYTYQPGVRRATAHLGRYPRHYGAVALWLAAMVLVPAVAAGGSGSTSPIATSTATTIAPLTASAPTTAARPAAPAAPAPRTAVAAAATFAGGVSPSPSPSPAPAPSSPKPAPSGDDAGEGEEPTPAGPGGLELPPPPPVPPLPVPEEMQPVLAAVAPLTSQGCSAIGLAGVVAAVAGGAAGDAGNALPVAQLLPYLTPAYSACATFPAPSGDRTICAIDEQVREAGYPEDASGLAKTPNVIGLGMDVFMGIETAIETITGQTLDLTSGMYESLGCHPDV